MPASCSGLPGAPPGTARPRLYQGFVLSSNKRHQSIRPAKEEAPEEAVPSEAALFGDD